MLKITQETDGKTVTLRLEGKLLGPWVSEARGQIARALSAAPSVDLDLSRVSYVDESGAGVLRDSLSRGVRIAACSKFIAELLQLERA